MISIHQSFGIGIWSVSVMLSWLPEPNVWTNDAWTPNIMDSYLNCFEGWGSVFDIDKILCIGQIRPYNVVSVVTGERMNASGHQIATSLTNKPRVQDWCWADAKLQSSGKSFKGKGRLYNLQAFSRTDKLKEYILYPVSILYSASYT